MFKSLSAVSSPLIYDPQCIYYTLYLRITIFGGLNKEKRLYIATSYRYREGALLTSVLFHTHLLKFYFSIITRSAGAAGMKRAAERTADCCKLSSLPLNYRNKNNSPLFLHFIFRMVCPGDRQQAG